jgi:predicted metal-dependent peptidase
MINQDVADQLTRARTQLILDHSFFGQLALRLPLVEDASTKTLSVDGKRIRYNPTFVETLSGPLTKAAIAHEVMHCVFDHIGRRQDRNPRKWNQAGDYVINLALRDSGFEIGKSWLLNTAFAGMGSDEVYNLLPEPDDEDGKDPLDECQDGDPSDIEVNATDWKIATIQAANQARAEGKLPASLSRFIEELTEAKIDWRAMLRRFITETSKDDYSWQQPNRHFIEQGFFLPTLYSESMGEIVVAIDTSGSISQEMLNTFGGEIKAIVQSSRPSKTHVIYCDSQVNHVDEFGPNDDLSFDMHGGGGTAFKPVFDYVAEWGIKPVCLVYLTDLYGDVAFSPPDYPVMWGCTTHEVAPWGETVPVEG